MRPVVVLFGAGASYGAGSILPESPPLGHRLSAELARIFPGSWGSLPNQVVTELHRNFERGMKIIWERYDAAVPQLMQDMAIYFCAFRTINKQSLYYKLIRQVRRDGLLGKMVFTTINYDCCLETAAAEEGVRVNYFDEPVSADLTLWKLHGSCNFISEGVRASKDIAYSKGVTFDSGIRALFDVRDLLEELLVASGIAPAMCLYMEGKPVNTAPSSIAALQAMWARQAEKAQLIITVGVRPVLEDSHIWGPILGSSARFSYCGLESEFTEASKMCSNIGVHLGNTFSTAFDTILKEIATYAT